MIRRLAALFRRPSAMTATHARQAVAGGAVPLDVRERDEWRAGHAPQARHLALSQLQNHLAELPTDTQIVTVCRSGRRSAANNLTGGMNAWAAAGLPVITNGNKPGQII